MKLKMDSIWTRSDSAIPLMLFSEPRNGNTYLLHGFYVTFWSWKANVLVPFHLISCMAAIGDDADAVILLTQRLISVVVWFKAMLGCEVVTHKPAQMAVGDVSMHRTLF